MKTTLDDKLPAFQKYLLEKNLAPAKNVPFYAHWVSRFLDYARRHGFSALEYQEARVRANLDDAPTPSRSTRIPGHCDAHGCCHLAHEGPGRTRNGDDLRLNDNERFALLQNLSATE